MPNIVEILLASVVLAAPVAAGAEPPVETCQDANGRVWRRVGGTVDSVVLGRRGVRMELHSTCVAESNRFGVGRWEWANGGFIVIFRRARIGFPRQEIDAGQGSGCRS